MCTAEYRYIIEAEYYFLRKSMLNPFAMMMNITLLDLHMLINELQRRDKAEQDQLKQSNNLTQAMIYVRDALNFATMGHKGIGQKLG